jgi:thiol:disulfide interchange protein DsbC
MTRFTDAARSNVLAHCQYVRRAYAYTRLQEHENTMTSLIKYCLAVAITCTSFLSSAEEAPDDNAKFARLVSKVNASHKVESVEKAEVPGFYEVRTSGGALIYADETATFFFMGNLYQLEGGEQLVDLTARDAVKHRIALVKTFKADDMIVFSPPKSVETKAIINVFTDVDCGYCQKLHQEVPQMNALGIEVRYMAFPRAGVGSETYKKLVSAWCADDQQTAMTALKARQTIPEKTCDNPVAEQFALGKALGVRGTPAIILQDGTLMQGYKPADKMAEALGIKTGAPVKPDPAKD